MKFIKIEDVEYHGRKKPVYLNVAAIQGIVPAVKNGQEISILITNCPRLEHSELIAPVGVEEFLNANGLEFLVPVVVPEPEPEVVPTVINNTESLPIVGATSKRGRKRSDSV